MIDSSGEIAISTLLIIGAAVFGLANAAFTAYSEHKAGFSTGRIIGDTICAGVMGYFGVYTAGLTLYQAYESYCRYHNMVPATHINATRGSVRFDVVLCNSRGVPIMALDFKTGSAILTPARINRMREVSQLDIPIFMIK